MSDSAQLEGPFVLVPLAWVKQVEALLADHLGRGAQTQQFLASALSDLQRYRHSSTRAEGGDEGRPVEDDEGTGTTTGL